MTTGNEITLNYAERYEDRWYATQVGRHVRVYERLADGGERLIDEIAPPHEWRDDWSWNFAPGGLVLQREQRSRKPSSLAQETALETTVRLAAIQKIAREELGLETLDARNSDRLDFHEHSVWQIRAALLKAYEAGMARR